MKAAAKKETVPPPVDVPPPSVPGVDADLAVLDEQARAADAALAPETPPPDAPQPGAPDTPAPPTSQPSTADVLAPLLAATFVIVAPAWNVQASESRALADAYGAVLDKYFPGGIPLGVEVNALLLTLAVFGPRWNLPRSLPAVKPAADTPADGPPS